MLLRTALASLISPGIPCLSAVFVVQGVLITSRLMSVSVAGVVCLGRPDTGKECEVWQDGRIRAVMGSTALPAIQTCMFQYFLAANVCLMQGNMLFLFLSNHIFKHPERWEARMGKRDSDLTPHQTPGMTPGLEISDKL